MGEDTWCPALLGVHSQAYTHGCTLTGVHTAHLHACATYANHIHKKHITEMLLPAPQETATQPVSPFIILSLSCQFGPVISVLSPLKLWPVNLYYLFRVKWCNAVGTKARRGDPGEGKGAQRRKQSYCLDSCRHTQSQGTFCEWWKLLNSMYVFPTFWVRKSELIISCINTGKIQ